MSELWRNLISIPWYVYTGAIGMAAVGICYLLDVWGEAREEWK